jgi:hypothetical protein
MSTVNATKWMKFQDRGLHAILYDYAPCKGETVFALLQDLTGIDYKIRIIGDRYIIWTSKAVGNEYTLIL